ILHVVIQAPASIKLNRIGMRRSTNPSIRLNINLLSSRGPLFIHQKDHLCLGMARTAAHEAREVMPAAMTWNSYARETAQRRVDIDRGKQRVRLSPAAFRSGRPDKERHMARLLMRHLLRHMSMRTHHLSVI